MDCACLVVKSTIEFYNTLKNDANGRYLSWEHCYTVFHHARSCENITSEHIDYLSLHLSFYLASWGMYRGSSFLLQKDYRIHIPAIIEILKPEYHHLLGISCENLLEQEHQETLQNLGEKLRANYNPIRLSLSEEEPKNKLSDTLITKILLGVLGCVPAYDRYFIDGVKSHKITTGNYNTDSITKLCKFYQENKVRFDSACNQMKIGNIPYPQMKFLDMGFWQIGFNQDLKNQKTT